MNSEDVEVTSIPMPISYGKLWVQVIACDDLSNHGSLFNKMDPYVKIHASWRRGWKKTNSVKNGGENVKFKERRHNAMKKFKFKGADTSAELKGHHLEIQVMEDRGKKRDRKLGHCKVPIDVFLATPGEPVRHVEDLEVQKGDEAVRFHGQVELKVRWDPDHLPLDPEEGDPSSKLKIPMNLFINLHF